MTDGDLDEACIYCPDCEHDARWHSQAGCMMPICPCRKEKTAIKGGL